MKKRNKAPLTKSQKEQKFISISARLLTIGVIMFAVTFSLISTFKSADTKNLTDITETLAVLKEPVSSDFIEHPIDDSKYPDLITKIQSSNLGILDNDQISYEKYIEDTLTLDSSLSLTDNELGLLYSYVHLEYVDSLATEFREVTITKNGDTVTLYTVCTVSVKKLYGTSLGDDAPSRIFLTNSTEITNNTTKYSNVIINNLDQNKSNTLELVLTQNNSINLKEYAPKLITKFVSDLCLKTSSQVSYSDHGISFEK